MRACSCNNTLSNTGTPTCKQLMGVIRKLILVPTYDSTGVRNKIAAGDTLNAAYFTALLNHADPTKRWYPTGLIDNIEDVRAEPIMETLNSGKKIFIQDGVRTFKGVIVQESNILIGKLKTFSCTDFSAYLVDKDRNLIGSFDGTDLYPIQIDKDTFTAMLLKTSDTTSQKIPLSFDYLNDEADEDLRMVTSAEMGNVNPLNFSGLLDVNTAITNPVEAGFTAALTTDYGSFKTPINVVGWVKADFTLYNKTNSAPIVITSVTESSNGVYDFVIPAQSSYDVLTLSATKAGYEFADVTITIG